MCLAVCGCRVPVRVCVCDVLPEVVKPHVKHRNMLWKRKCMFKGEELGQGKLKHSTYSSLRGRGRARQRDIKTKGEREQITY